MQSHYIINITYKGGHLFATHERSCVTKADAIAVLKRFKKAFQKKEGYTITITRWAIIGTSLDINNYPSWDRED